jgi:chromosome segregation ATPase
MSEDSEKVLSDSLHAMAADIKARDAEIERLRETARVYTEQFLSQEREATAQAKEIERLRAENENLKVRIGTYYSGNHEGGAVKQLESEIERLRAQRDVALDDRDNYLSLSETQRAEIERLRAVANRGGHLAVANAEIERLRAEEIRLTRCVGRLRAALDAIIRKPGAVNGDGYDIRQIAREALDDADHD